MRRKACHEEEVGRDLRLAEAGLYAARCAFRSLRLRSLRRLARLRSPKVSSGGR